MSSCLCKKSEGAGSATATGISRLNNFTATNSLSSKMGNGGSYPTGKRRESNPYYQLGNLNYHPFIFMKCLTRVSMGDVWGTVFLFAKCRHNVAFRTEHEFSSISFFNSARERCFHCLPTCLPTLTRVSSMRYKAAATFKDGRIL